VKKSYQIIFAGTPRFSAVTLDALIQSQHKIKAVYTQPDRPKGRGRKLTASPVKELALQHELPIYQPETLRSSDHQKVLADLQADLMIVVAYGLLLPTPVLQAPRLGCLNVHASLLPRWRGAAPIQRAILAGDEKTGITIMQMDEGLDTGGMLYKLDCPIEKNDTSASLHDKLAQLGAQALLSTLDQLETLAFCAQDNALVTYAHKIKKEEAQINWHLPALEIERMIRAFNPWPVAFFGENIRVWNAVSLSVACQETPGTILQTTHEGIDVATGKNILRLQTLQLPGGRALAVADLLNSRAEIFSAGKML
jgi:methionyl-tRNA formyltransferase